jgi:hypothetical protein
VITVNTSDVVPLPVVKEKSNNPLILEYAAPQARQRHARPGELGILPALCCLLLWPFGCLSVLFSIPFVVVGLWAGLNGAAVVGVAVLSFGLLFVWAAIVIDRKYREPERPAALRHSIPEATRKPASLPPAISPL